MRELSVRLVFTAYCLGNTKRTEKQNGRAQTVFLLPRSPQGRVVFMPSWWRKILRDAAKVLCRCYNEVDAIRFSMEVDGRPTKFWRRYYESDRFARHEVFAPGDTIGVTCLVPAEISDDDFVQLLTIAGKYSGISPAKPGDFGFFTVDSVVPRRPVVSQ